MAINFSCLIFALEKMKVTGGLLAGEQIPE
jgi:hypothetical protein